MRYLFATGALALLLAGSNGFAMADPGAAGLPHATGTAASAAGSTTTATSPESTQSQGSGETVHSPDVETWTATLIEEQQGARAHHAHRTLDRRPLSKLANHILSRTTALAKNLTRSALRFLGAPYIFGGTSTTGFDCSGFVQHVFAMLGMHIPRTADAQYYAGQRIKGRMKPGDLVFFQTYAAGPSHVGIYLGHGRFVHASSSHGVMVSSLGNSYWSAHYLGAKRLLARR